VRRSSRSRLGWIADLAIALVVGLFPRTTVLRAARVAALVAGMVTLSLAATVLFDQGDLTPSTGAGP
jgi:hypothetical protein